MFWNKDMLFCDIHPICYAISTQKEICRRHLKNLLDGEKYARGFNAEKLPNIISKREIILIKKGVGVDPELQENKAVNLKIACGKLNGITIHPGEVFSLWITLGKITKRRGYKDGRVLVKNRVEAGLGGGLCNLGNVIHWLVLHSPLDVTEFHSHSDALDPDRGKRVLFNSGTSVSYNYIDYRFKNNTGQDIQLLLWCSSEKLHGELRSERCFPYSFELTEENHHFRQEGEKYYRVSQIYKNTIEKSTGNIINKSLALDNHSEVMYDYSLIPKEMVR
ncbi:MAG: VanW family protein [Clostridiales bacterium]|jgi:vancomycin resistance protein VanW|nr:VanW family protein [Clostridiales bacterium]